MKQYKKKPTKLFQIRLSDSEYEMVMKHFKELDVTRRSWIISKIKETKYDLPEMWRRVN